MRGILVRLSVFVGGYDRMLDQVADFLCSRGADVHVQGMRARTPLEWAAFLGQVQTHA